MFWGCIVKQGSDFTPDFDCYTVGRYALTIMTLTVLNQIIALIFILSHKKIHISYKIMKFTAILSIVTGVAGPLVSILLWNQTCYAHLSTIIGYLNPGADVVETSKTFGR